MLLVLMLACTSLKKWMCSETKRNIAIIVCMCVCACFDLNSLIYYSGSLGKHIITENMSD